MRTLLKLVFLAVVLTCVGLSSVLADESMSEATEAAAFPLAAFEPFLNTTWKGLVDPAREVYDVARWELALGGQVVRMLHSVNDGAYGGETMVMWDRQREELVYFYFTTAGFYTQGTMRFDGAGRLVSRETVVGQESGITEVEATQTVLDDGRMRVETRMLRNGAWEPRDPVIYSPDATAEVVLPRLAKP